MGESLNGLKRTIMCGELREANVAEKHVVMGWVQEKKKLGGLVFIDLRDREGILQVVFGEEIIRELLKELT
jgi:aspartyl-tRNA synthetase